jgi:dihydropteroate synthase
MRVAPLSTSSEQPAPKSTSWTVVGRPVSLAEPVVMGILNVTPDSFSDGGQLPDVASALRRAERMIGEGAAILDVGGESTRPGAPEVDESEELRRVVPVVEALARRFDVPLSVDTRKAVVAREGLAAGASIVNDVSGMAFDAGMPRVVADAGAGIVLMHMRGTPSDMRDRAHYDDVVGEVGEELGDAVRRAMDAGVPGDAIVLDPGIGFAKTARQSLRVIGEIARIVALGFPVLVGPSRKSFLGEAVGLPPEERAVGTAVACVLAYQGGARLFRVHDVAPTVQALAVAKAVDAEIRGESDG